ncbi:MAG: hypothetical protein HKN56_01445 [Gammaproteobacteria bacterium]|nr:hypothetical protein [Gammaproteobacteria bacterium]
MSRYKSHGSTPRNWDVLVELDEGDLPMFEPIRAIHKPDEDREPRRINRVRQSFHRPRFG